MRPPLLALCVVLSALIGGLFAVGPASASITLTYSGTTIGINGTGDNQLYIGFSDTVVPAGAVTVRNGTGVVDNTGGQCVVSTVPVLGTSFHCPAGTTTLQANFGGGNDSMTYEGVCIPLSTVAFGDGTNELSQSWTDGCPATTTFVASAGSGNDRLQGGSGNDQLSGGGGQDDLRGGSGDDALDGGSGNDQVSGAAGNDSVIGGVGDDGLQGGDGADLLDGGDGNDMLSDGDANAGADDLRGGPGTDELRYSDHALGVTVSIDEVANDGVPGEGDNVRSDIEKIRLTRGNDTFHGGAGRDVVDGEGGNDVLYGNAGDDELVTGWGDDKLFGGAGADQLIGSGGNDTVDGGPGRDQLFGDDRSCSSWSCAAGADTILARDGEVDAISCGVGADSAVIDQADIVANDGFSVCESVDRATVQPPGGGGGGGGQPASPAAFTNAKVTPGRRQFKVRLKLRKAATVSVTVTRKGAKKALGTVKYKVKKAGTFSRTIRAVRGKRLKRGSYKVLIKVGATKKTLSVKVR